LRCAHQLAAAALVIGLYRDGNAVKAVGVDVSIAIITVGAGGQIDTNSIRSPVIGFIFDQKGLMYNLTLEGSKISRIQR
jgi:lipid-binding SYLF domain-containing protein